MPGSTNDGNAGKTFLLCRPNRLAHVGFALRFLSIVAGRQSRAQCRHALQDRVKHRGAVAAALDQVVPPALAVAVARGLGQPAQRVGPGVGRGRLFISRTRGLCGRRVLGGRFGGLFG